MSIAKRYKSTSLIPCVYICIRASSLTRNPSKDPKKNIDPKIRSASPLHKSKTVVRLLVFSSQRKYNLHRYRWNEQSQEVKENISGSYDMWLEITGALLNVAGSEELTILTHRKEGQPFGLAVVLEGWVMVARCWQRYYCLSLEDVWRWINPTKILFKLIG